VSDHHLFGLACHVILELLGGEDCWEVRGEAFALNFSFSGTVSIRKVVEPLPLVFIQQLFIIFVGVQTIFLNYIFSDTISKSGE
jgi:hypothetical protein